MRRVTPAADPAYQIPFLAKRDRLTGSRGWGTEEAIQFSQASAGGHLLAAISSLVRVIQMDRAPTNPGEQGHDRAIARQEPHYQGHPIHPRRHGRGRSPEGAL